MEFKDNKVELDFGDPGDRSLLKALTDHMRSHKAAWRVEYEALEIMMAAECKRVKVSARTIGTDSIPACFVCQEPSDEPHSGMENTCLMCGSQDEAEIVLNLLPGSRIAYYHGDPKTPQVKVGACEKHLEGLSALQLACYSAGYVDAYMVSRCVTIGKGFDAECRP